MQAYRFRRFGPRSIIPKKTQPEHRICRPFFIGGQIERSAHNLIPPCGTSPEDVLTAAPQMSCPPQEAERLGTHKGHRSLVLCQTVLFHQQIGHEGRHLGRIYSPGFIHYVHIHSSYEFHIHSSYEFHVFQALSGSESKLPTEMFQNQAPYRLGNFQSDFTLGTMKHLNESAPFPDSVRHIRRPPARSGRQSVRNDPDNMPHRRHSPKLDPARNTSIDIGSMIPSLRAAFSGLVSPSRNEIRTEIITHSSAR